MNKWIMSLMMICVVFAQEEENLEKIKQSFVKAILSDEVENIFSHLKKLQNRDVAEVKLMMNLLWEHQKAIFQGKNKKIISNMLCPFILKILSNKETNGLQVSTLKVLSLLDTEVILTYEKLLFQLIDNSIHNRTDLAGNFFEYFILQKEACFPEITALIVKEEKRFFEELFDEIIGKIFFKCNSDLFWKNIIGILKENSKNINFQIIFGFQYCLDIDRTKTIQILIKLFQNDDLEEINDITLSSLSDIFLDGFEKHVHLHKKGMNNDLSPLLEIFNLSDTSNKQIKDLFFYTSQRFWEEIVTSRNLCGASSKIAPLVIKELETNPRNRPAELLLLLDPVILIQNKSELKNIFTKHIVELNDCLGKLILKEEGFIDFLPIFLNNPDKSISGILFDIYEKYQEQTFPYFEQGLKGSDECKKRIISVMLRTKNNLSEKFLTKHFIEVFNNLYVFPFPDNPTHNFRRLMVIVDISDIIEIVVLEKVDIFHYNGIMIYEKVIDAVKKILKDKNFQIVDHPYLQNLQHGRLGIPIEIIQDNDPILRKNLLSVILEYKMDREDAIIAVLYYLLEAAVEKNARKEILTFPQEKIRTAFAKLKRYLVDKDASGQEVEKIEQKLMEIFGASFFPEGNKE